MIIAPGMRLLDATFRAAPRAERASLPRDVHSLNPGALKRRGPVGGRMLAPPGSRAAETLAGLVLDGVLEIEHRGRFVSGPAAHVALFGAESEELQPTSRLARLSASALRYGHLLGFSDASALAARLYRFNTLPASPRARRRWPNASAVAAFLEVDRYLAGALSLAPARASGAWLTWRHRGTRRPSQSQPHYKLYVSPVAEHLRDAFDEVMGLAAEIRAFECKIGCDLGGMLRPDKLVVYFRSFGDVRAAGDRMARALAGMQAQGVPFTADLAGDGLLSWGADPPRARFGAARHGGASWRTWVTRRLAEALVHAQRSGPDPVPPWRFARDRVALMGVDPVTWAPAPGMWGDATDRVS